MATNPLALIRSVRSRIGLLSYLRISLWTFALSSTVSFLSVAVLKFPLILNNWLGAETVCSGAGFWESCCKFSLAYANASNYFLLIVASVLISFAICTFLRRQSLSKVSEEQAASKIDSTLGSKERAISWLELQQGKATSEVAEPIGEMIYEQLDPFLRGSSADQIVKFQLSKSERIALYVAGAFSFLLVVLLFLSAPIASAFKDSNAIEVAELAEKIPDLPEQVKKEFQELAKAIEENGLSSVAVKDGIKSVQESIQKAQKSLESESLNNVSEEKAKILPTATPTSTATPKPNDKKESQQSSSVDTQNSKSTGEKPSEEQEAKEGQAQNESQQQQSEGKQQESQQQEEGKKEDQQGKESSQGQEGSEGKDSQAGKEGQSEKKEAQSGQGGEEGESKGESGKEGKEKQDQKGEGSDKGSEQDQKGEQKSDQQSQQKQEGQQQGQEGQQGQQSDQQKQGGQSPQSGASEALSQAQQEMQKLEQKSQQQQNQQGEGKNQGSSSSANSQNSSEGQSKGDKQSNKDQKNDQKGDSKSEAEVKKEGKEGEQGDTPKDQKSEKQPEKKEKGNEGSSPGEQKKKQLDRDAELKEASEGQLGENEAGLGDKAKFNEAEVKNRDDEKFDERFTGQDAGQTEAKETELAPSTSIRELDLAKPEVMKQGREQPIPLEYEGMF